MPIIILISYIVKVDLSNFQIVLQKTPNIPEGCPSVARNVLEGVVK